MPKLTISGATILTSSQAELDTLQCLIPDRPITIRDLITLAVREQCWQPVVAENQSTAMTRLDPDREVTRALDGFRAQAFIVLVGDRRCTDLDETVTLALMQPVQFVRMIPLVGG